MRHPFTNTIRIAACRRIQVSRQVLAAAQELCDTGGLSQDALSEVMAAIDHGRPDLAREILESHFTMKLLAELPDDEFLAATPENRPEFPILRLHEQASGNEDARGSMARLTTTGRPA